MLRAGRSAPSVLGFDSPKRNNPQGMVYRRIASFLAEHQQGVARVHSEPQRSRRKVAWFLTYGAVKVDGTSPTHVGLATPQYRHFSWAAPSTFILVQVASCFCLL